MAISNIIAIIVVALVVLLLIIRFTRRSSKGGASSVSEQVYVGNLHYRANEYELRKFFSRFGKVLNVRIVKDRHTRRSKGFAFVTFHSSKDAQSALSASGQTMKGRTLVVRIAKPRPE